MTINYTYFGRLRATLATLLILYAINVIWRFATAAPGSLKRASSALEVIFWTLVPSAWFFFEYWAIDHRKYIDLPPGEDKEKFLKSIKDYADYASKIWAAVLAVLTFLFGMNTQ